MTGETYRGAGVDIAAGDEAVRRIRDIVASTSRPEVLGGIGGFGGLFDFSDHGYDHPVLVSATDGVGTKAAVAAATGRYDTIGIDLVAMCVDDLACVGAEPLLFLDYLSVGSLDPEMAAALVSGVATGCREAGCALVGGEMAEHPGAMAEGEFDLVGFALGVVERNRMIDGSRVEPGDVVVGLESPGLRSNGYSLARRLYLDVAGRNLDEPAFAGAGHSVAEELLVPSVIYNPTVLAMRDAADVRAVAHITGGGMPGNVPRSLPDGLTAVVDRATWLPPPVFGELQQIGSVADDEMDRVFNLGVAMTVVVAAGSAADAIACAAERGHRAWPLGWIEAGRDRIRYV